MNYSTVQLLFTLDWRTSWVGSLHGILHKWIWFKIARFSSAVYNKGIFTTSAIWYSQNYCLIRLFNTASQCHHIRIERISRAFRIFSFIFNPYPVWLPLLKPFFVRAIASISYICQNSKVLIMQIIHRSGAASPGSRGLKSTFRANYLSSLLLENIENSKRTEIRLTPSHTKYSNSLWFWGERHPQHKYVGAGDPN